MKKQPKIAWYKGVGTSLIKIIETNPLVSFSVTLALVVALIIAGNLWRTPKIEPLKEPTAKKVTFYQIGTAPTVHFQGQVEKSGITTIVALAGGVVQKVSVVAGSKVSRSQTLISLSQNYQGGSTANLARQIAQKQYDLTDSTYDTQRGVIAKQRDLANQNKDNSDKLRDMNATSSADTKNVINLNNDIMDTLQKSIDLLNADPASNAATILSTKQYLAQFKASTLQLSASQRSADYQGSSDNPPAQLASTQHDLLIKQLDLQEQSLSLSRDISKLSLQVAQINESMYYPASPFSGIVQRVFVRPGQYVSPGTPLVSIVGTQNQSADVSVAVPLDIAIRVSKLEKSKLKIGDKYISLSPSYISTEAISGNQHVITFHLSGEDVASLTDKSFIDVELPLGNPDTFESQKPSIPIDSVYQTENSSMVFIEQGGKAISRTIELGPVLGDNVQVNKGLGVGDRLILDRSVQDGDPVQE